MSKKQKKEIEVIESFRKKISKSKAEARAFLILVGIITPKGNFRKPYRHLKYWKPK